MSDPKTSAGDATSDKDEIEDAVILDADDGDTPQAADVDTADDAAETDPVDTPEPGLVDGVAEDTADADETVEAADETADAADPAPATSEQPTVEVVKKTGFLPVALGGVVAAAVGAGAALFLFPNGIVSQDDTALIEMKAELTQQVSAIEALQGRISDLPIPPDQSAEIAALQTALTERDAVIATQGERIEMLSALVGDLEKRPIAENLAPEAIAAYERELKSLQAAMAEQRAQVEAKLAEANALEAAAKAEADAASARDALGMLSSALDNGDALTAALTTLEQAGITAPDGLAGLADGVPTLATLQDSFPDAARAALASARKETGDTGVGNFLRDQLGVRSLTPQEGADANAVLSRAEAALKSGDLTAVLAELAGLTDGAADAMAAWQVQAQTRADAMAALAALRQTVMTN